MAQGVKKEFWKKKRQISKKGLSSSIVIGDAVKLLCVSIDVIVWGSSAFHLFQAINLQER